MKITPIIFLTSFIITILPGYSASSTLKWRLNGEGGIYKSQSEITPSGSHLVTRLNASLQLVQKKPDYFWDISFHFKPQFFRGQQNLNSYKFFFKGRYLRRFSNFDIQLDLDTFRNFYRFTTDNLNTDLFRIQSKFYYHITKSLYFKIQPSYFYQDWTGNGGYQLDAVYIEIEMLKLLIQNLQIGLGLHAEHFETEQKIGIISPVTNSGERTGPRLFLGIRREFILSMNYFFYFHKSDITDQTSHEQNIQFYAGTYLRTNWTLFLYLYYYWNRLSLNQPQSKVAPYIPVNNSNQINIKLEHQIRKKLFLYMKFGYFTENILLTDLDLKGWQTLLGIELSR